jgi:O-succinylhomoserine sulfhydrylase
LDKIKLCSLSPNLEIPERLLRIHPASTTHSKLSVEERLAVSIDGGFCRFRNRKDVIADLSRRCNDRFD